MALTTTTDLPILNGFFLDDTHECDVIQRLSEAYRTVMQEITENANISI